MTGRLHDKVVLISGGASGIGAAHAQRFAKEGAKVVIGDLQEEMGQELIVKINKEGGDAEFLLLDVTNEDSWAKVVSSTVSRYGKLTSLINNAGIGSGKKTEAETVEGWNRICAVNQTGVWLGMRASIPEMLKVGGGSIVNISSIYGMVGSPAMIAYHASKGAVRLMTKAAALEYAPKNIRINSVHPGIIETPLAMAMPDKHIDIFVEKTPLGRLGKPGEIAAGSLFLISDDASFVTGSELVIDGGFTAQ